MMKTNYGSYTTSWTILLLTEDIVVIFCFLHNFGLVYLMLFLSINKEYIEEWTISVRSYMICHTENMTTKI